MSILTRRLRLLFGLTLVSLSLVGMRPRQQDPIALERLEFSLWPEFDRPAVLVIYRATLPADANLPTTISLPIPAASGDPHAVARASTDGSLLNAEYTRSVNGDWATLEIQTDSPVVWVEFYQQIAFDGQQRRFEFVWPGGVAAEASAYEIQQPFESTAWTVSPPAEFQRSGEDGLTYHRLELGPRAFGDSFAIELSYSRSTSELSVDRLQAVPSIGRPETTLGDTSDLSQAVPWIVGVGLGALLLAAGLYVFRLRPSAAVARRRRRSPRRPREPELDTAKVYCHNCGTPAGVSDRFCRNCGVQLRR